jgi:transposase
VALVSPQRVRRYARAKGRLAKTDQLDAQILADYGKHIQPRLFAGKSEERKRLSALVGRRTQLNEMLQAEKIRLRTRDLSLQRLLERVIDCLEAELDRVDQEIEQFLHEHQKLLRSAKSIGRVTAATLLANLPALGQLDRKEIAALVGLAPLNRDRGRKRGDRRTVRGALYRSAWTGIRYNPILKAPSDHLVKRGKEKKVAITACMRKMLTILNARMRDQQSFRLAATS